MGLRVIKANVLVELDPPKQTSGLIILLERSQEKQVTGTIIDAAPAAIEHFKATVQEDCLGRRVVCTPTAGTEIVMWGKPHLVIDAKHVLGFVS